MAAQSCICCNHPPLRSATNTRRLLSPTLPEELIGEILLRLPVRSLLKFRSICKSWKTLISDPQFAKNHLQISTAADTSLTNQQLLYYFYSLEDPYKITTYPMKSLFEKTSTCVKPVSFSAKKYKYMLGSCNGLLCMFDHFQHVNLLNPSTRFQSKNSPKVGLPWKWKIPHHGFGYDRINDKYKVLIVFENKYHSSEKLTKIYTFGEDSWKTIQNFQPGTLTRQLGKFVSGTLNWIVDKTGVNTNQCVILSFDLAKESYVEVPLPQNDGGEEVCEHRILCVLSNCLCVCDTIVSEKSDWVVWLMKQYGVVESWTKLVIIPREKFTWISVVEPLFFSKNDVALLWNTSFSGFILYKLNSGEFDYPSINSTRFCLNLHVHCESLVSPRW